MSITEPRPIRRAPAISVGAARRVRELTIVGGIVILGLVAEHVADSWFQPAFIPILDLATGWLLVGCGLAAMAARPGQPAGGRLVLAGYLWFVGTFSGQHPTIVQSIGFSFGGWHDLVLLWLALSFPRRWPAGRLATGILILAAALFAAQTLIRLGVTLPPAIDLPGPDRDSASGLIALVDVLRTAAVVIGGLVILGRIGRAPRPERRHLWPVLTAGAAAAVAAGYTARFALSDLGVIPDLDQNVAIPLIWVFNIARLLVPLAILLGVLRLRTARAAIAGAVVRVGDGASIGQLQEALGTAFGDPELRVLEWRPGASAWIDASGDVVPPAAIETLARDRSIALVPVDDRDGPLALLVIAATLAEDDGLVSAGMALIRLVVRNGRQAAKIREQLAEVRASRARIVEAGDVERRRIERDLHDGLQQRMVALAMALRAIEGPDTPPSVDRAVRQASTEILEILDDVRELARGIHPAILTEAGLGAAIRAAADRSPVPAELDVRLAGRGSTAAQATSYYVISEALANVAKHAAAASGVWIRASDDDGALRVSVEDDGPGGATAAGHGLAGLADRVAALDGRFVVEPRIGGGTRVVAEVPIP